MIKLGMMARETKDTTIEEAISFAAELELDVIDLHLAGMSRESDYLHHVKRECIKNGLPIGYLGGGSLVGPGEERPARMEKGRADVDLTAFMGAQMLRVFARHKWPDTVEEQEALWGPMIASFQELADYAAPKGVTLGLQNHDNGSFAMTADQVLRILRETDRDNLTFLMDTGQWLGSIGSHPRGEFDPDVDIYKDYLERTAPHAELVRAKIYKIDSGREEFLDYERILGILQKEDFNGIISLVFELGEFNKLDQEECIRLGVAHLRQVINASYQGEGS
jgi:sugar phosphate isomerase/epimerase